MHIVKDQFKRHKVAKQVTWRTLYKQPIAPPEKVTKIIGECLILISCNQKKWRGVGKKGPQIICSSRNKQRDYTSQITPWKLLGNAKNQDASADKASFADNRRPEVHQ